jgi:cytochrome P450
VEGWTNNDLAGFEITICFSALTNTVPNALSLLCHVLENPTLYADIREEVKKVTTKKTVGDVEHATIDITAFNDKCPILISSYWENIRLCVNGTPVRVATEDVTLKDAYNIEKGAILLATGGAMQESKKVWGSDADQFNGRRFLSDNVTREQQKHMLPFGGGKHLCPGRHLALTEIISFVALIVYGYEIEMRDGSKLVHAGFKTQLAGENSKKPLRELNVTIRRKEEFKGVIWGFEVGSAGV